MFKLIEIWDNIIFIIYNLFAAIRFALWDKFKYRKILKKNQELKNRHKGEDCFVVLNGPSINGYDLKPLKEKLVICANFFHLSEYYDVVEPNYHCMVDSDGFKGTLLSKIRPLLHTERTTKFIFNKVARDVLTEQEQEKVYFVYGHHLPTLLGVKCDLDKIMSSPINVGLFCIQLAVYLGCSNIYILGLDFAPGPLPACYKSIPEQQYGIDVYKKNSRLELCSFHWYYFIVQLFSFYVARQAKQLGVNVYNLNKDSWIRAFDIARYEDIIRKKDF